MPRYPLVEKTIHGEPVSHTQFLNAIVGAIDRVAGGGRVADLVTTLGPEWDTPARRKLLATTLANLAERHVIKLAVAGERGKYVVSPHYWRVGTSAFDGMEKGILDVIRSHGGFCQFRDIVDFFDVRPHGPDKEMYLHDSLYSSIVRVIAKSTRIRQDFIERGVYNLPWDEVAAQPLRGRWAALMIRKTLEEQLALAKLPPNADTWRRFRDDFFANVGERFQKLRRVTNQTIPEMLEKTPVKAALLDFMRAAPMELAIIRQDWFDRTSIEVERMRAEEGRGTGDDPAIEQYRDARDEEFRLRQPEWLYKRFERGELGAHMKAPLLFYKTIATHFGVCPAQLSRGVIAYLPDIERLRPRQDRASPFDMMDRQIENELVDEARLRMLYSETDDDLEGVDPNG